MKHKQQREGPKCCQCGKPHKGKTTEAITLDGSASVVLNLAYFIYLEIVNQSTPIIWFYYNCTPDM